MKRCDVKKNKLEQELLEKAYRNMVKISQLCHNCILIKLTIFLLPYLHWERVFVRF